MNNIFGEIPSPIGNLTQLSILSLQDNMIGGSIPISLGNCSNLLGINLGYNHLIGTIPQQIFAEDHWRLPGSEECSKNHFSTLYMKGNHFEGTILKSFKQLKGLQILDVSHNNLSGQIPRFLAELPFLQNLNLSFNMFDSEVPNGGVFKNISAFSIAGNNKLCGGIKALQLLACPTKVLKERKQTFTPRVIALVATLSFLNSGEQIVTVKVLNLHEHGATKSFVAECEALKNIRHRNLVKIITSCSTIDFRGNDFKALVFEFMENGGLESWLHSSLLEQQEPKKLNFVQRLNIAIDVASAMDYLHNHCEMTVIHCDLKPSNILLDGDLCAHVSDFGLAQIFLATTRISNYQQSSSIGIRGTIGYVAPQYGMSDMYSYGVLPLEMFTGKRPTHNIFTDNVNLHSYIKICHPEQVMQIVDPHIILEMEEEPSTSRQSSTTNIFKLETCLVQVLQIGIACFVELPSENEC
ncbi:hypothetical protein ACSBR1_041192 [Camellia fascicularis]